MRRVRAEVDVDETDLLPQPAGIDGRHKKGTHMIMRQAQLLFGLSVALASAVPAPSPAQSSALGAASLTAVDAKQKDMVVKGDVAGLTALASADLRINAPTNRILTRDQFIAMLRSGQIGAEAFERTVESATVSGNVGIVMGSEVFTPTANSELGKTYRSRPLKRRFTNIYIANTGHWRWLARHANLLPDRAPIAR